MKRLKTYEGFGYSNEDYFNEVMYLLKQSNLRPVEITKLFDFYSEMIEEYMNDGKSPKIVVDEIFNLTK